MGRCLLECDWLPSQKSCSLGFPVAARCVYQRQPLILAADTERVYTHSMVHVQVCSTGVHLTVEEVPLKARFDS